MFGVQFALNEECLHGNFLYSLGDEGTVCLFLAEGNLKGFAFLQRVELVLQSLQHHAHATNEVERHVGTGFLDHFYLLLLAHGSVEFVLNFNVAIFHIMCFLIIHSSANVQK